MMKFAILDDFGDLQPFECRLYQFEAGNRCLEWGEGQTPCRIQLHYTSPPPLAGLGSNRVCIEQAHVTTKNRNLIVAGRYLKRFDVDWLLAIKLELPPGFRGKPVFVPGNTHAIWCDNKITPPPGGRFILQALLMLRSGEEAFVNDLGVDRLQSHWHIRSVKGSCLLPEIKRISGFYLA